MMLRLAVAAVFAIVESPASVGAQTSAGNAAASVDTLWDRNTSTLRETFIGGVLGLGFAIVAVSRGLGEESGDTTVIWLGSNGIGTVERGNTGAPVGIAIPRWKRRYP